MSGKGNMPPSGNGTEIEMLVKAIEQCSQSIFRLLRILQTYELFLRLLQRLYNSNQKKEYLDRTKDMHGEESIIYYMAKQVLGEEQDGDQE